MSMNASRTPDPLPMQPSKDPIEQQILAAGNLSEAQVEARLAEKAAVNDHSRGAARQVIGTVSPYATAPTVSPR